MFLVGFCVKTLFMPSAVEFVVTRFKSLSEHYQSVTLEHIGLVCDEKFGLCYRTYFQCWFPCFNCVEDILLLSHTLYLPESLPNALDIIFSYELHNGVCFTLYSRWLLANEAHNIVINFGEKVVFHHQLVKHSFPLLFYAYYLNFALIKPLLRA